MYSSLLERSLDLAAGTRVDARAYETWGINLARLQALGRCYRGGWLHNVLSRITPLTVREADDYVMMADLFVATSSEAELLLARMSRDLGTFAAAAGINPASGHTEPLQNHLELFQKIGTCLSEKFGIAVPLPFGSTTLDAEAQEQIPFVRDFIKQHFSKAA